jgi:hypothetical protein
MVPNFQRWRHSEAPRFLQRGEGSRAQHLKADHNAETFHARSLARLKNALLRDDARDADAVNMRKR